jgi:hypothetical protein
MSSFLTDKAQIIGTPIHPVSHHSSYPALIPQPANAKFLHGTHHDYDIIFSQTDSSQLQKIIAYLIAYDKTEVEDRDGKGLILRSFDPQLFIIGRSEDAISALLHVLMQDVAKVVANMTRLDVILDFYGPQMELAGR